MGTSRGMIGGLVGLVVSVAAASASAQLLGPTPYLSASDSPFSGLSFGSFFLENFEDGSFNTPGVSASAGWIVANPSGFSDSVDGDDGSIDGSGATGRSFYSGGTQTTLTLTFDAIALGGLPTHAGLVWTDVGNVLSGIGGTGDVTFEAFGPGNVPLGSIGPVTLGDGSALSATAEDRFFGVISQGGISSIRISMPQSIDWEVDHVQYGIIPAPGCLAMAVGGLVLAARRKRL